MSALAPLVIEDTIIEHQISDDGAPIYAATEIAQALGYADPHKAISEHTDEDDWVIRPVIDSLGRKQRKKFVTGVAVQMLIFRSNLPKAREYTRRVAKHMEAIRVSEVPAPVLAAPKPRWSPGEIFRLGRMCEKMLAEHGVAKDVASAATLELVRVNTGVDMESARKVLPGRVTVPEWLNATQVGEPLGISAREVNKLLEKAGLQTRAGDAWQITDAGKQYGEAKPYERNGHSGFQVMWRPIVVAVVEAARAEKPAEVEPQ